MTLRPHIDQTRFVPMADDEEGYQEFVMPDLARCCVPRCGASAMDPHHVWSRRHVGMATDCVWDKVDDIVLANVVPVCRSHHEDLSAPIGGHKAQIEYSTSDKCFYWRKLREIHDGTPDYAPLKVNALLGEAPGHPDATQPGSFPEQDTVPVRAAPPSPAEVIPAVASAAPHVHPGEKCPTCERKFPHPKKPSSPTSKTKSFRLPLDVADSYDELVEAAAEHLGIAKEPFAHFNAVNAGLVLVLQSEAGLLKKEAA
jgi:hypothetical protein